MMKNLFIIVFFSLINFAQAVYTPEDVEICQNKFQLAIEQDLQSKPINEAIIEIGKSFLGLDYEAHTLEKGDEENLVVHLTGLDCYTFLESALVFARCIKQKDTTFECYQKELEKIRYRNGEIKDYLSRLHYFSEWIYEMNKREVGKNITKEIGGEPYKKEINFMSTHPNSYERLKNNPRFIVEISKIEQQISKLNHYYITQERIQELENKIESGDILGITTNIKGLDISHTGIAIRLDDGRIHLLHAPTVGKQIEISEKPLAEYVNSIKHQTGIMVLRPNNFEE